MDEFVRSLERKWGSTGATLDGVEYLLALLRSQASIELATFPIPVIEGAKLPVAKSNNFRQKHTLYGRPISEILGRLQTLIQPYWEAHQPAGGVPAFDRLAHWFAAQGLPEEQALAAQEVVAEDYEGTWPEYDNEDTYYDLVVWYPAIPEIRVFTASEYADELSNIQPDWSSGQPEVPQNIPSSMGVLREFVFRNDPDDWVLTEVNIINRNMGLWGSRYSPETWEELVLVSEWHPGAHLGHGSNTMPNAERREYYVLYNDLNPNLPLSETPRIERGRCEDFPACGHAERDDYGSYMAACPPRWSHTGRQVAMICATCRREMPLGGSSICNGCFRGMMRDPYDPYYGPDFEGEFEEDDGDFEDDRAWYEHGDDYGY